MARVLRNPAYLGHARQGETVNVEAHEPIVTQAEFDAANQKRQPVERRAVTEIEGVPVKASMADRALLRGIAVCANCGHNLRAGNGWLDRKTGERLPFYYCPGRFTSGKCEHRANLSAPPARSLRRTASPVRLRGRFPRGRGRPGAARTPGPCPPAGGGAAPADRLDGAATTAADVPVQASVPAA